MAYFTALWSSKSWVNEAWRTCAIFLSVVDGVRILAPALRAKLQDGAFDIVFLTGIGEVFPYIRSHNVLNNLQSVVTGKPMLMKCATMTAAS